VVVGLVGVVGLAVVVGLVAVGFFVVVGLVLLDDGVDTGSGVGLAGEEHDFIAGKDLYPYIRGTLKSMLTHVNGHP
jgi:hypothetical protein